MDKQPKGNKSDKKDGLDIKDSEVNVKRKSVENKKELIKLGGDCVGICGDDKYPSAMIVKKGELESGLDVVDLCEDSQVELNFGECDLNQEKVNETEDDVKDTEYNVKDIEDKIVNYKKNVLLNFKEGDDIVTSYIPSEVDETLELSGVFERIFIRNSEVVVVPKIKEGAKPKKKKAVTRNSVLGKEDISYSIDKIRMKVERNVGDIGNYVEYSNDNFACEKSKKVRRIRESVSVGVGTVINFLTNEPYALLYRHEKKSADIIYGAMERQDESMFDLFGWNDLDKEQRKFNLFEKLQMTYSCKHITKTGVSQYRDNYYITDTNLDGEECSYWIGVGHNSTRKNNLNSSYSKLDVTIEYNPMKCKGCFSLDFVLESLFSGGKDVEVRSLDLAIDLYNVDIADLSFVNESKRGYRVVNNGSNDITYYVGKRASNGALKIYNKAREIDAKRRDSKNKGRPLKNVVEICGKKIDIDDELDEKLQDKINWTRYEVTLCPWAINKHTVETIAEGLYEVDETLFPKLTYLKDFNSEKVDLQGVDKFLLEVCAENPNYLLKLKSASRSKYKKIEQLLQQDCSITFDYCEIKKVICEYFKILCAI